MRFILLALCLFSCLTPVSQIHAIENYSEIIGINNRILVKINNQPISVLDLRKHMDLFLQKQHPNIFDNPFALFQFYQTNWKSVLVQMVDQELMIAEADEKEIKVPDGELREMIISRFGANLVTRLDKLGLTYEDAKRMIEKELIAQRMQWYHVHSKVYQKVNPSKIQAKYDEFCMQNPPKTILQYRVIQVRGANELEAKSTLASLKNSVEIQKTSLKEAQRHIPFGNDTILISDPYEIEESKLADKIRTVLSALAPRQLSSATRTTGKTDGNDYTLKAYFLESSKRINPPSFEKKYQELENQVFNEEFSKVSSEYMNKLRVKWHQTIVYEKLDEFEPFYLRKSL